MQPPEFWYPHKRGQTPALARMLAPVAALYGFGAQARHRLTQSQHVSVPVICVGNLTVGGAGKTPVVIALAEVLSKMGRKPFILTRGFGGALPGPVRVDAETHSAAEVGDEPLLLARAAPVIVCRDRPVGARYAVAEGADIILMDDGFQNPTLHKDYSLVVVDGRRFVGNGRVFPAGPLRESVKSGLARADAMIIMGGDPARPLPPEIDGFSGLSLRANLVPQIDQSLIKDKKVLAFAGIGAPARFFQTVRSLGARIVGEVSYPDHYPYTTKDIRILKKRAFELEADLVTTEKDAVRLPPAGQKILTVPVKAEFANKLALKELLENWTEIPAPMETVEIRVNAEKRKAKLQHYPEAAVFFAVIALFRALGLERASAFGGWLTRTIGPRIKASDRARRNLALVMPELSSDEVEDIVYKMWDNLGRTAGEYAHLDKFTAAGTNAHIELVGEEIFNSVRAEGKGAIMVSGHFANWELMPLALRERGGRGAEIYRAPNNPFIDNWLIRQRSTHIFPVQIPKGAEGGRPLLKVIRAGQDVAMLVDQKMNDGIPVPFFGLEAMTPPAAAALSLRYKVPIIPARMERLKGTKFRLIVHEPPVLASTGDMNMDIYNLSVWLNEFLEKAIRERPEQWLWLHQRWGKFKNGKLETRKNKSAA